MVVTIYKTLLNEAEYELSTEAEGRGKYHPPRSA